VQSLEASIQTGKLLGKLTIRLIVKLIDPASRKLSTQAQAEQSFGGKITDIKPGDQIGQRDQIYNITLGYKPLHAIYIRKKSHNISHAAKCALKNAADWRSHPDTRSLGIKVLNKELINSGAIIATTVDQLLLSMGIFGYTYNNLLVGACTTIDALNEFESVFALSNKQDAESHNTRLTRFRCYPIEECQIEYQVMQWNGRAKSITAQIG
jgi:hypothetical protein